MPPHKHFSASRREKLQAAWVEIERYEQMLIERLINGLQVINRARIYGITKRTDWKSRVATVSIRKEGTTPEQLAKALGAENVFAWDGNCYALGLSEALGVEESGGLLRLGLVHYNTLDEIDVTLAQQVPAREPYYNAYKPPDALPRRKLVPIGDPYEPLGIRAGTFLLKPSIDVPPG